MYLRSRSCKIDKKAVFPLAHLIWSFLQNHHNIGDVCIWSDRIEFSKHIFFTVGKIMYEPYGLVCRNGIIYSEENNNFSYPNDDLFTFLVNALLQLKEGYMIPF